MRILCNADTGNTIFMDNASTGETYELNGLSPEWRADPKIINKFKTSVCSCDSSVYYFASIYGACFNLDIYNVSYGN